MNDIAKKEVATILGYLAIGMVSLVVSFLAAIYTFVNVSILFSPGGFEAGDGFGFIILLMIGVPIWITIAILSPIGAHLLFKESSGRIKRIVFSLLTPVVTAVVTSAIITWWLQSS